MSKRINRYDRYRYNLLWLAEHFLHSKKANKARLKLGAAVSEKIPDNLISVAKKTPGMTAGIVCADHESSMESAKKAIELDLIKPAFIGNKNAIKDKAEQIKWDLSPYEIINSSDEKENNWIDLMIYFLLDKVRCLCYIKLYNKQLCFNCN